MWAEDIKVTTANMFKELKKEATREVWQLCLTKQQSSRKDKTQSNGSSATDMYSNKNGKLSRDAQYMSGTP